MADIQAPPVELTARAWAEILIERWKRKIRSLNIGYSQDLINSIMLEAMSVAQSGGNIEFMFLYYGKFTDMGVGRGVSLGDVGDLRRDRYLSGRQRGNYRRPRKWYTDVFYKEVTKLRYILAENYGIEVINSIIEAIEEDLP